MKIKSFKQFIVEADGKIDLGHGLWTYSYEDRLHGTIDGYNYLINNWGLTFTEDEKPKHKSQVANKIEDYINIPFSTIKSKLTAQKTLFIDNDRSIKIEFYRFIEPETRAEIQDLFQKAQENILIDMSDKYILKYMPANELYLYPYKGKKLSHVDTDDYRKTKYEL